MRQIKLFLVKSYNRYDDYGYTSNKIVCDTPQLTQWINVTDEQYELLKDQEIRNRFIPESYLKDKKSYGYDYSVIMVEPLEVEQNTLIKVLDPILDAVKAEKEKREKTQRLADEKRKKVLAEKKAKEEAKKIAAAEALLRKAGKL